MVYTAKARLSRDRVIMLPVLAIRHVLISNRSNSNEFVSSKLVWRIRQKEFQGFQILDLYFKYRMSWSCIFLINILITGCPQIDFETKTKFSILHIMLGVWISVRVLAKYPILVHFHTLPTSRPRTPVDLRNFTGDVFLKIFTGISHFSPGYMQRIFLPKFEDDRGWWTHHRGCWTHDRGSLLV